MLPILKITAAEVKIFMKGAERVSKKDNEKPRKFRYRIDILLIISVFIIVVTFCAYMMNTELEETLEKERGAEIVTHDYTYDDSSQAVD